MWKNGFYQLDINKDDTYKVDKLSTLFCNNKYLHLLPIVFKNVEKMFLDRKYILEYNDVPIIHAEDKFFNSTYICSETGNKIFVTIIESRTQIKNYNQYLANPKYCLVFFIYLNYTTNAHLQMEIKLNHKIQIFSIFNLMYNVVEYQLTPTVTKINFPFVIKGKLPKIDFYDPLVRYYNFQKKDILELKYPNAKDKEYVVVHYNKYI